MRIRLSMSEVYLCLILKLYTTEKNHLDYIHN